MKVIIAGGSGLIGSALSKSLLADGHQVLIISRKPGKTDQLPSGVKTIGWASEDLIRAISSADAVVNLAGASIAGSNPFRMRWTAKRKAEILESRLEAGAKLTKAIQAAGTKPEVLIQASAIGYYGNVDPELVDETSSAGDDFLAGVCQAWEGSTKDLETLGVRRVIIRIGLVFSQVGGLFQLLKLPFLFYLGGRIGSGNQYLSWIHIDDLVAAIRYLIANQFNQGVFNLTAPNPIQNRDFSQRLGKILTKPAWFPVPGFVLRLLLGEASTLALDGRQVYPTRLLDSGFGYRFDQLDFALRDLLT
ncbi:MAG: TIGR01777 family oxidoreductase [Anaerolineales bacterium]